MTKEELDNLPQPLLEIEEDGNKLRYYVVNSHTAWRVTSLHKKEPDTVAWLRAMPAGSVLVDAGANMGIYTIYAAVRGVKVWAFEPEAQNYALLTKNIMVNRVSSIAYCVALSNEEKAGELYLSGFLPGGSCHTFGENVDHRLVPRETSLVQGCMSYPLDWFKIKADYVKIDVDGFEHKVVSGGANTIKGAKSVLIEINTSLPEHMSIVEDMLSWGFTYDPLQVESSRRKEGAFKGVGNYIFRK